MNNNLLVFLNDGAKRVMAFPLGTSEERALSDYHSIYEQDELKIKKYFFMENDTVSPQVYQDHYEIDEDEKLTMNMRNAFSEKAYLSIKKQRDNHLKSLDIPFMMSIESDDLELKNHIIKVKSFLRDLPNNLNFSKIENDVDILRFNPFSNIFNVFMINGGSGYDSPPLVTIDSPNGSHFGFQAKAVAFVSEGKVQKIEVTDYGCGYDFAPKVIVEAPESGKQAIAANPYPENSLLSQKDIVINTKKHYAA